MESFINVRGYCRERQVAFTARRWHVDVATQSVPCKWRGKRVPLELCYAKNKKNHQPMSRSDDAQRKLVRTARMGTSASIGSTGDDCEEVVTLGRRTRRCGAAGSHRRCWNGFTLSRVPYVVDSKTIHTYLGSQEYTSEERARKHRLERPRSASSQTTTHLHLWRYPVSYSKTRVLLLLLVHRIARRVVLPSGLWCRAPRDRRRGIQTVRAAGGLSLVG